MNRNDFIKKFPVGSKVRLGVTARGNYLEVICHGTDLFFAKNNKGEECCWDYACDDWLPYEEPKEELKLWDVVFDDTLKKEGIVVGDVPCGDLWVFVPDRVMCRTIAPERLKKVEGKVAVAPATVGSGNRICSTMTLYADFGHASSENGKEFIRWPHSIASLTIEEIKK